MKNHILNTVDDLVGAFLYYDRKEDEDLSRGEIQKAIARGDISSRDIVQRFEKVLLVSLSSTSKGE